MIVMIVLDSVLIIAASGAKTGPRPPNDMQRQSQPPAVDIDVQTQHILGYEIWIKYHQWAIKLPCGSVMLDLCLDRVLVYMSLS